MAEIETQREKAIELLKKYKAVLISADEILAANREPVVIENELGSAVIMSSESFDRLNKAIASGTLKVTLG